ncbi:MAG: DJ-1/PfpI family protein [Chloroflexi bacterium]|nr:DJ-1/PfpI family protein [Chloroflexota bacterium]
MSQRNVAIFIFDDVEVLDFAGPFEVFNVTGEVINPAPFNTYTVAMSDRPVKARGSLSINPHYTIENCPQPDILLIPGGWGTRALLKEQPVLDWITMQSEKVANLLSVCTGALLLGKAGLLDGLKATTHHDAFDLFRQIAPETTVIEDQRFVDEGKIITSGGISAGIDMSLYVVRRLIGDEKLKLTTDEMEWRWYQGA